MLFSLKLNLTRNTALVFSDFVYHGGLNKSVSAVLQPLRLIFDLVKDNITRSIGQNLDKVHCLYSANSADCVSTVKL